MEDDDDAPTAAMMTEPKLELPCPPGTDLGVLPCWPPALLPSPAARVFLCLPSDRSRHSPEQLEIDFVLCMRCDGLLGLGMSEADTLCLSR